MTKERLFGLSEPRCRVLGDDEGGGVGGLFAQVLVGMRSWCAPVVADHGELSAGGGVGVGVSYIGAMLCSESRISGLNFQAVTF